MKDIIDTIWIKLANQVKSDREHIEYLGYMPSRSRDFSYKLVGFNTAELKEILHYNFGDTFMVNEYEVLDTLGAEIHYDPEQEKSIVRLQVTTRVGIAAKEPIVFFLKSVRTKDTPSRILDGYIRKGWNDKGLIVVNESKIDFNSQKMVRSTSSGYSHTPIMFEKGSQYRVTKIYTGNGPDTPPTVVYHMDTDYNSPKIPEDKLPLSCGEDVHINFDYTKKQERSIWQKMRGIAPFNRGMVWVFRKNNFHPYNPTINSREIIGEAADIIPEVFSHFPYKARK
jgi:hypothetical protein